MPIIRNLVFVDCETTGLDTRKDKLVEVSWANETGPVHTLYLGLFMVPDFIDKLIGFTERNLAGRVSSPEEWLEFTQQSVDNTMVAANPGFDREFLMRYGITTFHHRMLDIESFAMAKLNLNYMPGMHDLYKLLPERGFELEVEPDHTSANDVLSMREMYHILKGL